jgi:hypothetical protein
MNGERTVGEIAQAIAGALPEASPRRARTVDEARDVITRYAR